MADDPDHDPPGTALAALAAVTAMLDCLTAKGLMTEAQFAEELDRALLALETAQGASPYRQAYENARAFLALRFRLPKR
jgi:hypothetical protein